jgi:hypothetical protein
MRKLIQTRGGTWEDQESGERIQLSRKTDRMQEATELNAETNEKNKENNKTKKNKMRG